MRIILHSSSLYVLGAIVMIGIALVFLIGALAKDNGEYITATAERGPVAEIVSVSGVVEAENSADLAFPASGIVDELFVSEGTEVTAGDILATQVRTQLEADRLSAVAALQKAQADKEELVNGPRAEERTVTQTTVQNAEAARAQVILEQNEIVENARRTLLSSGLAAYNTNENDNATAPTITGTYTCDAEGSYVLNIYGSSAPSGFSYTFSGLEGGTQSVNVDAPLALGACGLFIEFADNTTYSSADWILEVPNMRSSVYQTNVNAYELAKTQRDKLIEAAENDLLLAQNQATLDNAEPRGEALLRANADILDAQARLNAIDAQIADRAIEAPFDGIITDVEILAGETATTEPVITLLASDAFDLTARIPEIDITKIREDQRTLVTFDAASDEVLDATISFISPLATEIDGVAYFEATVELLETPEWLRSGLNADVEIIVAQEESVIRLPKRFVSLDQDGSASVLTIDTEQSADEAQSLPVEVVFMGNDGYVGISGIAEGTTVIAP